MKSLRTWYVIIVHPKDVSWQIGKGEKMAAEMSFPSGLTSWPDLVTVPDIYLFPGTNIMKDFSRKWISAPKYHMCHWPLVSCIFVLMNLFWDCGLLNTSHSYMKWKMCCKNRTILGTSPAFHYKSRSAHARILLRLFISFFALYSPEGSSVAKFDYLSYAENCDCSDKCHLPCSYFYAQPWFVYVLYICWKNGLLLAL